MSDIDRSPPHNPDAEMGVVGSIMLGGVAAVEEARAKLKPEAFYIPAHQTIFNVLCIMRDIGMPLDLITVTNTLRDQGHLDNVGGAGFVTSLFNFVPTHANLPYYIEIVRDKFMLREAIRVCTEGIRRAYEDQDEPISVVEDLQSNVIDIDQHGGHETSRTLAAFVPDALKQIELTYRQRGHCTGISTGFVDMDRMMNGFEAPLTYCFAARPSMGKSSLMLAFAKAIALSAAKQRRRVMIFSVEMTGQMLAKRLICDLAGIKLKDLRYGFMDHTALDRAKAAAEELMTDYIRIDEKGDLSIFEYRARARQAVLKDKCELIMIDYLQRMKGSSKRAALSRELEINEIAQGISATGKELKVPTIVLAQLNREAEKRKGGKPELGDLRESGSIEQEMRFVGLLWRPKYYATSDGLREYLKNETEISDDTEFDQHAQCIIAKQNEGPVGPVPLRFIEDFARYEPQDPNRPMFSTNESKKQHKPKEPPPPEEPAKPPRLVQEALEIFTGAKVVQPEKTDTETQTTES